MRYQSASLIFPALVLLLTTPSVSLVAAPKSTPQTKAAAKPADSTSDSANIGGEFASLQKRAKQNDPEALLQIGRAYLEGNIIAKDDTKAAECFRKAADLGNWKAQNNVGLMYARGQGVEKDPALALKYLRQAATQGNMNAQENLAVMLLEGRELPKDLKEAMSWFEKAGSQGSRLSQHELAYIYFFGRDDVKQDYALTAKWARLAADQGDAWAQNTMGILHQRGLGVEKDVKEAYKWFSLAAEQGDGMGQGNLGLLIAHRVGGMPADKVSAYKWLFLGTEQGVAIAENAFKEYQNGLTGEELFLAKQAIEEFKKSHPATATAKEQ